jgi:hypothetical protein
MERVMKRTRQAIGAAFVAVLLSTSAAYCGSDGPSATTDPGFVPQTGQINPGHAAAPWSAAKTLPQDEQPAQNEARAALMVSDPVGVVSLGAGGSPQQSSGEDSVTTGGVAAGGGAPNTNGSPLQERSPPSGPIGSTIQTLPAKYSQRNDLLDHLPVMAWPLKLTPQQQQQIYQAAIAQQAQPVEGVDDIKPAASLSFEQANSLRALPPEVAGIKGLQGLKYVRGKNTVLLVQPSNRIVVDEVKM